MDSNTVEQGKTIAIISYFYIIGVIIAFIMNNDKKNAFASFHIRQMVGLVLASLINGFVIGKISFALSGLVGLFLFVLWIIGLISAVQGETKKIPVLGDYFQDWFKGIS